ncbi:unnamed protein product [Prorocentrum cordatum]|uniref:Uncharacterized protein n=1 Tax=Prorocentrum cordatum TaxID=2364126 RepID=A0ABN9WN20_9DINO|nr:unnamed protein product [Polarella glacialis]
MEKFWLFTWAPASGHRTVQVRTGSINALTTPTSRQDNHLYDGQGKDAFNYCVAHELSNSGVDCVKMIELTALSECTAKTRSGDAWAVHPLGYEVDTADVGDGDDGCRSIGAVSNGVTAALSRPQQSSTPPPGSTGPLGSLPMFGGPAPGAHAGADGELPDGSPLASIPEGVHDGGANDLLTDSIGADAFDSTGGQGDKSNAVALPYQTVKTPSDPSDSCAPALSGKPAAANYIEALSCKTAMASTSLGFLHWHACQYLQKVGGDLKADAQVKELRAHLDVFEKCRRFNSRHSNKFTFSALVQTANELRTIGHDLQQHCWEVPRQKRAAQLRTDAETSDAVEALLKACYPGDVDADNGQDDSSRAPTPSQVELHHLKGENETAMLEMFFETAIDLYLNLWSSMHQLATHAHGLLSTCCKKVLKLTRAFADVASSRKVASAGAAEAHHALQVIDQHRQTLEPLLDDLDDTIDVDGLEADSFVGMVGISECCYQNAAKCAHRFGKHSTMANCIETQIVSNIERHHTVLTSLPDDVNKLTARKTMSSLAQKAVRQFPLRPALVATCAKLKSGIELAQSNSTIDTVVAGATAAMGQSTETFDTSLLDRIMADAAKCNGLGTNEAVTKLIPHLVTCLFQLCVERGFEEGLAQKAAECVKQLGALIDDTACPCHLWSDFLKTLVSMRKQLDIAGSTLEAAASPSKEMMSRTPEFQIFVDLQTTAGHEQKSFALLKSKNVFTDQMTAVILLAEEGGAGDGTHYMDMAPAPAKRNWRASSTHAAEVFSNVIAATLRKQVAEIEEAHR